MDQIDDITPKPIIIEESVEISGMESGWFRLRLCVHEFPEASTWIIDQNEQGIPVRMVVYSVPFWLKLNFLGKEGAEADIQEQNSDKNKPKNDVILVFV